MSSGENESMLSDLEISSEISSVLDPTLSSEDEFRESRMRSETIDYIPDADDDDDDDIYFQKRRSESVGDASSTEPGVSNLRRKKHSFARMVDLKIDLDLDATYRNPGTRSGKEHSVPHTHDDGPVGSPEGRGSRFNLLGRCRSGSETDEGLGLKVGKSEGDKEGWGSGEDFIDSGKDLRIILLEKEFQQGLEKDLVHSGSDKDLRSTAASKDSSAAPSPLLGPPCDSSRRASDTNVKYNKPTKKDMKKVRLRVDSVESSMDDSSAAEEADSVSPMPTITKKTHNNNVTALRKARVSLPFIKYTDPEPDPDDGEEEDELGELGAAAKPVGRPPEQSRTRRQTFAHTTNMRMRAAANGVGAGDDDMAELAAQGGGDLDSIGETQVQEFNLDFDLAAMRKKSCFVLTSRPVGLDTGGGGGAGGEEGGSSQPDNLTECTNLVRAIEFAAFEINELHQKQQKNRRASCPAKHMDDPTDKSSPKRWRKKTSILGWMTPSSSAVAAAEDAGAGATLGADGNIIDPGNMADMKRVVDDFKDSDIIISNVDRLVGRRGGVAEKCNIERQLVKHAVKHLMKNAILQQAI